MFLNRCERLRNEYESYGLLLDDARLIRQVKLKLSRPWLTAAGLAQDGASALSWDQVAVALQTEDNNRRHANTDAVDAVLPLGWTPKGEKGKAYVAMSGHSDLGDSDDSEHAHAAPAVAAKGKGSAKGGGGGKSGPSKPMDKSQWVCFHCIEPGHGVKECPTKPAGWKPTEESRRRVHAKKAELAKAKQGKVTHPSV